MDFTMREGGWRHDDSQGRIGGRDVNCRSPLRGAVEGMAVKTSRPSPIVNEHPQVW